MSNQNRYFPHGAAIFVGNRLCEGLPFVPNEYINLVLYGILARASELYPRITSCLWLFMCNHYHGIIVCDGDAEDVRRFMNYLDGEVAKAVSKFLGQKHKKFWQSRYTAAVILDAEKAMEMMVYSLVNPCAAHLVERAQDWPGVSTAKSLFGPEPSSYKCIPPSKIHRLPNKCLSKSLTQSLVKKVKQMTTPYRALTANPFAWKQCFAETVKLSDEILKARLLQRVREKEDEFRKERLAKKLSVLGVQAISTQNPHKRYKPTKFERKVFFLSTSLELRLRFLKVYREFKKRCVHAWNNWKLGDYSVKYPPCAFLPTRRPMANVLPAYAYG